MAILQHLKGIEVTVCTNKALTEYTDEDLQAEPGEDGAYRTSKTISKYIECVTGHEFSIRISVHRPYHFDCPTLGFAVYIDGAKVRNPILRKKVFNQSPHYALIVNGVKYANPTAKNSQCILKKFAFSAIETTGDDEKLQDLNHDARSIGSVGEIEVRVERRTEGVVAGKKVVKEDGLESKHPSMVHERALKGQTKSHGVSLGAAQPSEFAVKWDTELIDGEERPMAIFKFKYRDRESLKSLLIIRESELIEPDSVPEPDSDPEHARTAAPAQSSEISQAATSLNITDLNSVQQLQLNAFLAGLRGVKNTPDIFLQSVMASNNSENRAATPAAPPTSASAIKAEPKKAAPMTPHAKIKAETKDGESRAQEQSGVSIKRESNGRNTASSVAKRRKRCQPTYIDLTEDD